MISQLLCAAVPTKHYQARYVDNEIVMVEVQGKDKSHSPTKKVEAKKGGATMAARKKKARKKTASKSRKKTTRDPSLHTCAIPSSIHP